MKLFERYTATRLLRGFGLVLFVLVSLFSLTALIDELNDVGKGRYEWTDALLNVLLTVPNRALDLVPLVGFLGGVLALGNLASTNELVAMRAVGISPGRIALACLKAGGVFVLAALLAAEFVAPPLGKSAEVLRSLAIHEPGVLQVEQGFWFREGPSFVRVGGVLPGRRLSEVDIFTFDGQGSLLSRTRAHEAQVLDSGRWVLSDVQKDVLEGELAFSQGDTIDWESTFVPQLLELTVLSPQSLSLSDLFLYVRNLRERGQAYERYQLRLWRYLGLPLTTGAMLLLSIPFVFALRRSSSGLRTTMGCIIAAGAYALDRIGGHLGLIAGLDPILTALSTGLVVLVIAGFFLRRMR